MRNGDEDGEPPRRQGDAKVAKNKKTKNSLGVLGVSLASWRFPVLVPILHSAFRVPRLNAPSAYCDLGPLGYWGACHALFILSGRRMMRGGPMVVACNDRGYLCTRQLPKQPEADR